ncbi:TOMM precursor leader peptide-binding protein [Dactylosporangium maewongense]|uniref:TOMM leader peptide-binding protein n=1 Tax=Dactylosporangium maewongense TaxID=634393 RepID=A0ABP4NY01_9ACTN
MDGLVTAVAAIQSYVPQAVVGVLGTDPAATVHLTDDAVLIGSCDTCLALRRERLQPAPLRLAADAASWTPGPWPHLTPAVLELIRHLHAVVAAGTVFRLAWETLDIQRHELLPDPSCPACGTPAPADPIRFVPRPKPSMSASRLRDLDAVHLPERALVNPVCGALGPAAVALTDAPIVPVVVGGTLAGSGSGANRVIPVMWSGHARSYGRSRTAALLEGLERTAAAWHTGTAPVVVDTFERVAARAVPGDWPSFDPRSPIRWVPGHSLRHDAPVLVPERMAYFLAGPRETSNGCAIGTCLEEAALHGLLELIERDAFLIAWYGRAHLPELAPGTVTDPAVGALIDRLAAGGHQVRLFDTRIDLPAPVVTAVAVATGGAAPALCFAAAAGLDPDSAVAGAVGELAALVPAVRERALAQRGRIDAMRRDHGLVESAADHAALFADPAAMAYAGFLLGDRHEVPGAPRPWPRPSDMDLLEDLQACAGAVMETGSDVIVVDLTTVEQRRLGLRSARVIAPGLVPLDFGPRQRAPGLTRISTALRHAAAPPSEGPHHVPHPLS